MDLRPYEYCCIKDNTWQPTHSKVTKKKTLLYFLLHLCHHTHMETPVQILIKEFNGVRPLARAVHRDAASISRWQKSGLVPTSMQKKVLETAWDNNINISAHELIFGRDC